MVLLEGINTGSAKVSVELPYPEYQHIVSPLDVNIVVLANIILDPSDVHILVGDSISFRILQVNFYKSYLLNLKNLLLQNSNRKISSNKRIEKVP